jgi:hypothetical protein
MQFTELQKKYEHYTGFDAMRWTLVRYSKKGNRVMHGEQILGYDNGYCGGHAYATWISVVVDRKTGEVHALSIHQDDWDY